MHTTVFAHMIGVPFTDKGRDLTGFDCWGAVRYALREAFGIEVPSYADDYVSTQEGDEIARLIAGQSLQWGEVPLSMARPGDVLILRRRGRPWHCGLVVDPPWFLHADVEVDTVRERWDAPLWRHRVVAVYRHPELSASASDRGNAASHVMADLGSDRRMGCSGTPHESASE